MPPGPPLPRVRRDAPGGRPAAAAADASPARRSIAGNAVFSLLNQIVGATFTGGLTIFLARRLGTHGYGTLSLALGLAGLVLLPSDFGTSNSVSRFVADHADDRRRIQDVVADGLRLKFGAALTVSLVLFALAGQIAQWYHAPSLAWPVRGLAVAVFAQSVMLVSGLFITIGRTDLQVLTSLVESAVQVSVTVALVLAGAGATGAAFGQAIGYFVGAAFTLALLTSVLGPQILPRGIRFGPDARTIAGYAGALLIVDGAYTIFNYVDILVIGSYLGTSAVALFSAPSQMIAILSYPGAAVSSGVAPRLSRVARGGPNVPAFLAGLRLLLIVQTLLTAFVVGWAPMMVRIVLGTKYDGGAEVLRALAPFVFLTGFGSVVSLGANYLGEARKRIPIAVATMALNFGADLLLVPRIGVVGGAWATDAAFGLYAPAHLWICQRALGIDLESTALTCVRALIAGALATAVLLLFGDSIASADRIVLTATGGVIAVVVYVGALLAVREVRPEEAMDLLKRVSIRGRPTRRR